MTFDYTVCGIPCRVDVVTCLLGTADSRWEPGDPREIEFDLLDRRGRRARWLEAKVDDAERLRIENEIERREREGMMDP